ncbi:Uu.00g075930.m01.CDS01 [Anthostomella pinea]|uniref:Uu.00g075930.m01.CDS01 n=1 Tax=Anthostomella pinea TaxID=933095 RepID=A0AAI8VWZ2_9PEZI|nr:Uu.00g075930.m01.CDS01 [Anthostomella pinea]
MATQEPSRSMLSNLSAWGNSSMAPTGLATLITALHFRPLQIRPLLFAPVLLFSSYANLQGFKKDSAGITAAASGTYALLAFRRRAGGLVAKFMSVRGAVRGAAVGVGLMNCVAGGWVYAMGDRERERAERRDNPRWG